MGKITETLNSNATKGKAYKASCSQCKHETNHIVLQSVDIAASEVVAQYDDHAETIEWSNHYQIIQCQGCDTISFRHASWCSENQRENEFDNGASVLLYPKRSDKAEELSRLRAKRTKKKTTI